MLYSSLLADVESDAFWSNLSPGDENKMTFDCDDLFWNFWRLEFESSDLFSLASRRPLLDIEAPGFLSADSNDDDGDRRRRTRRFSENRWTLLFIFHFEEVLLFIVTKNIVLISITIIFIVVVVHASDTIITSRRRRAHVYTVHCRFEFLGRNDKLQVTSRRLQVRAYARIYKYAYITCVRAVDCIYFSLQTLINGECFK